MLHFCSALVAFSVCLLQVAFGQALNFKLTVLDYETEKSTSGKAFLYRDSVLIEEVQTDSLNNVQFNFPAGSLYKIVVHKETKVDRYILVDLKDLTSEHLMYNPNAGCYVGLFEEKEGKDYSYFLNKPITVFTYDTKQGELLFDADMAKKTHIELEKILVD